MKKMALLTLTVITLLTPQLVAGGKTTDNQQGNSDKMPMSFDWQNYKGSSITLLAVEHPLTNGIREVIDDFTAATGINVTIQAMAESLYFDRMNVALRTKGNVDVYMVPMDGESYIQQSTGLSQSISPYLDNPVMTAPDYNFADYPDTIMDLVKYPDGYYAIPVSLETYIVMYNKKLLQEYANGMMPKDMDELISIAMMIKEKANGKVAGAVVRGIRSDTLKDTVTALVYNAVGGNGSAAAVYLDGMTNFANAKFNQPDIIRGLQRYAQLMMAGPNTIQSMDWAEASRAFELGKAAFFVDANLFAPGFEAGPMKGMIGYSVLPPDNAANKSYSGFWGWGLGIAKQSTAPAASWMLIQWLSHPDNDARLAAFHGSPARNSTWDKEQFYNTMPAQYIDASKKSMASSRSSVIRSDQEKAFYLIIIDAIQDIYSGMEPEKAVEKALAKAKEL